MPRVKKQFALIWWIKSAQKDIIPLSNIPKCKQKVNSIVSLTWKDFRTNEESKSVARVLAISDDENKLYKTIVTDTGDLHDSNKKIFSAHIINENKTMVKDKKLIKNIKSLNRKELEDKIKKSQHIVCKENRPLSTYIPKRNTSPLTTQIYNYKPTLQSNTPNSSIHNQQIRNADNNIMASQADYSSHTYPNNEFISQINNTMEVSSMVYDSGTTTNNASPQNSFINLDKNSNTPSSLIYSAASRTLQNNENVISNNKVMESTSSRVYSAHESTHDTLYTQNTFKDSSAVYPMDSSCTFSNRQVFASNTNNVMESALSTVHNSSESIYDTNTRKTFMNPEKNIITTSLSNSGSSRTTSDHQECTNASSFSGLFPWTVRRRDIEIIERLLTMMKTAYREQTKMNIGTPEKFTIPNTYFADDDNKEELSPNCGFYLPKSKKTYIKLKYDIHQDWKVLVRETLLEVYGSSIANYSATGKRGNRPPINRQLFKGLFEWVNNCSPEIVEEKTYINFINKLAFNKRKYINTRKQQSQQHSNETNSFGEEKTSRINENDENERNDNVESDDNYTYMVL